jgi:hypothetical protein
MNNLEQLKCVYVQLLTDMGSTGNVTAKVEADMSRLRAPHDPLQYLIDCIFNLLLLKEAIKEDAPFTMIMVSMDNVQRLIQKYDMNHSYNSS